jgi:hypothetical protein
MTLARVTPAVKLWHFTCDHGYDGIGTRGFIVPMIENPFTHLKLSWFTDQAQPDRERTGLTMEYTTCDRMAYRYRVVDDRGCRRWLWSAERARLARQDLSDLESYGDPEHWWIADEPTLAVLS